MNRTAMAGLATVALLATSALPAPAAQSPTPGTTQRPDRATVLAQARARSADLARRLDLAPVERLTVRDAVLDPDGREHIRYDRTFAGMAVIGGDLVAHLSANGSLEDVSWAGTPRLRLTGLTPRLDASAAIRSARAAVEHGDALAAVPHLVVWASSGTPRLAWRTAVGGDGDGRIVVTDATDGTTLQNYEAEEGADTAATGTGNTQYDGQVPLNTTKREVQQQDGSTGTTYVLIDSVHHLQVEDANDAKVTDGTLFSQPDDPQHPNTWGNSTTTGGSTDATTRATAAADVLYALGRTVDFYKDTFSRNGYDGNGTQLRAVVHALMDDGRGGSTSANAQFNYGCMCMLFGDGGSTFGSPLTSIDIAGHEFTHGVTRSTASLEYTADAGGLNEATSDIFGTMVEFYANNAQNTPNYRIGEKMASNSPLRYMDQPSRDGRSYDCYRDFSSTDPHLSSGPGNHFFYLLAEGPGTKTINGVSYNSPTCDHSTFTGIGRDRAAQIWYKALTSYMTSTETYPQARIDTLRAAADLYGTNSPEYLAVAQAWAAVGVGPIHNGGFEQNSLIGWSSTGSAQTYADLRHGGAYSGLLLQASGGGDSTLSQTFAVSTSADPQNYPTPTRLSLWWQGVCTDASSVSGGITLTDLTAGTSAQLLAPTCAGDRQWHQVTGEVTAGHAYTVTATYHDTIRYTDHNDMNGMLLDDVELS